MELQPTGTKPSTRSSPSPYHQWMEASCPTAIRVDYANLLAVSKGADELVPLIEHLEISGCPANELIALPTHWRLDTLISLKFVVARRGKRFNWINIQSLARNNAVSLEKVILVLSDSFDFINFFGICLWEKCPKLRCLEVVAFERLEGFNVNGVFEEIRVTVVGEQVPQIWHESRSLRVRSLGFEDDSEKAVERLKESTAAARDDCALVRITDGNETDNNVVEKIINLVVGCKACDGKFNGENVQIIYEVNSYRLQLWQNDLQPNDLEKLVLVLRASDCRCDAHRIKRGETLTLEFPATIRRLELTCEKYYKTIRIPGPVLESMRVTGPRINKIHAKVRMYNHLVEPNSESSPSHDARHREKQTLTARPIFDSWQILRYQRKQQ